MQKPLSHHEARKNITVFVKERKWIILKFNEVKLPILVKRVFQKKSQRKPLRYTRCEAICTSLNAGGDIGESKPKHNVKDSVPQPDIDAV